MSVASTSQSDGRESVSPQEFARLSGLSLATVRRYLSDGRLPSVQPGGRRCRVLIPRGVLAQFLTPGPALGLSNKRLSDKNALAISRHASSDGRLSGPVPRWKSRS